MSVPTAFLGNLGRDPDAVMRLDHPEPEDTMDHAIRRFLRHCMLHLLSFPDDLGRQSGGGPGVYIHCSRPDPLPSYLPHEKDGKKHVC